MKSGAHSWIVWLLTLGLTFSSFWAGNEAIAQLPAEQDVTEVNQAWLAYQMNVRFTKRSGLWVDVPLRRTNGVDDWLLYGGRVAYQYFISPKVNLVAGGAYMRAFSPLGLDIPARQDFRAWQQITNSQESGKWRLWIWLRTEQRWITTVGQDDPARFSFRFRPNALLYYTLNKESLQQGALALFTTDDLMINMGKRYVTNMFDQNRFSVGLAYMPTKNLLIQTGYMRSFLNQGQGKFVGQNALRVFLFQTLDLRKTN
jgi:hypothetical protein